MVPNHSYLLKCLYKVTEISVTSVTLAWSLFVQGKQGFLYLLKPSCLALIMKCIMEQDSFGFPSNLLWY